MIDFAEATTIISLKLIIQREINVVNEYASDLFAVGSDRIRPPKIYKYQRKHQQQLRKRRNDPIE